jgi:signal transduction histidine kinase
MLVESRGDSQVQLNLEIPNEMVLVNGDPTRLKQVLLNLMSNAVKFTTEGQINVYLRQNGNHVRWGVMDTGIGIQSGDLVKLFKPFEQVSEDLSAKRSGTGLGLALSREIILAHGGDISVESEAGQGSDFFVVFETEKV